MSNLKIKDIETLEALSLDELEQVVGGRGRRWGRRRFKSFGCGGDVITAQIDAEGIELDSTSNGQGRGGRSASSIITVQ